MLGARRGLTGGFARLIASPFVLLRVPPNALTAAGALFSIVPALFFAYGDYVMAGLATAMMGGFDMVDGAVARATGRETRFGGFLDSVLDRIADAVVLFGVGFGRDDPVTWLLVAWCVIAQYAISYARARSHQDVTAPAETWDQFFERPERILFLSALALLHGLLARVPVEADLMGWGLAVFGAVATWTAAARVLKVRGLLGKNEK